MSSELRGSQMNTVLDLPAGWFDDALLGSQMRLVSGMLQGHRDAAQNSTVPAEDRWLGFEGALTLRLNQLMAEMNLRGMPTPDWLPLNEDALVWPAERSRSLGEQLSTLKSRQIRGEVGRIEVPDSVIELWACTKYSVLARNLEAYHGLGRRVASRSITMELLLETVIMMIQVAPRRVGLVRALRQMSGHIAGFQAANHEVENPVTLMAEIQQGALETSDPYLLKTVALSELAYWSQLSGEAALCK